MRGLRIAIVSALLVLAGVVSLYAQGHDSNVILRIDIVGNRKIGKDAILAVVQSKVGKPLDMETVQDDLKAIYRLGYFNDVQADVKSYSNGKILTFFVVEKPYVVRIFFKGNKELKRDELSSTLAGLKFTVLNKAKILKAIEKLKAAYADKGYYDAKIDYRVESLQGNEAAIHFDIEEGSRGYVKKINFIGNKHIKSKKLKKVIHTKTRNWLSWITGTGKLNREILKVDVEMIKSAYYDKGFLEVKVDEPIVKISKDGKSIYITFRIYEGPQYKVESVNISGDLLKPKKDMLKLVKTKSGKYYSSSVVRTDIMVLTDLYSDQGYAYVDVSPITRLNKKNRTVKIDYDISKGNITYFGKINIEGNFSTRDNVIRRVLAFSEGGRYSSRELKDSRHRLKETRLFEKVDITTHKDPKKKNVVDVDVKVEEGKWGSIGIGAGYSTQETLMLTGNIEHKNLFGRGYYTKLKADLGAKTRYFRWSFTNPSVRDSLYMMGIDLYHDKYIYDSFSSVTTGGSIRTGRPLPWWGIYGSVRYTLQNVDIYNIDESASIYVKDQRGKRLESKILFNFLRDRRNSRIDPTRGTREMLSFENGGGPLGGDVDFWKTVGDTSWYHPFFLGTTVMLHGRVGAMDSYSGKELLITEKFFVGGLKTIRGFEYGYAGPRDINGDPIGAKNEIIMNAELIFPIYKEIGLKGVVFFDAGKGFDSWGDIGDLRTSTGFGLRWLSPMGPLRLEWGYNLDKKEGEKQSVMEFTVGQFF
jgi:outer membrane protein insertion porin family